jgi:hypothetical protein
MTYAYDIFISYKRDPEANQWIQDHFEPLLTYSVGLELGRQPKVFRDNRLAEGGSWPVDLGRALGLSKVLVCLWTKTYFHSDWCVREMAAMLEREQEIGFRSATVPSVLVLPSVLHDCDPLPGEVSHIQYRVLRDFFNVRMRRDSAKAELLADALTQAAPAIAQAIEAAPAWQAAWPAKTAQQFMQQFYKGQPPSQMNVPGFGG